jgi:hypothetical protein
MKSKFVFLLLIVFYNPIFSQEKKEAIKSEIIIEQPENGKLENRIYTCYRFDWKIIIPEGYKVTDPKRTEELENKGYDALKKEVPNEIKLNRHPTQLIGFEINKYNYFKSSFESLIETKKVTLEEHKKFCEQLLIDAYSKIKALKFESTTSDIKLGKYNFYKIQIRLYNPKDDTLLVIQELYNSFINDHLFSVSINYTNEKDGMILNYAFNKSLE